ncbi:MAG: 5'-3' exonuclease H3TH domain-containing protein [Acidobacteriota bacterium]
MAERTVYLIDASPYIFRAFFSLPESMTDRDGQPVNAIYGFASFLLRLFTEEEPSHLACNFDGRLSASFRSEIYPPYKAQRDAPPESLKAQVARCREIAEALGVKTFIDNSLEADDLCGILARQMTAAGHRAVVVTSDKDLAQLVDDQVELFDFAKGQRYGPAEVEEKFGVPPQHIQDFLALAGDTVDNIPGVPGIGKKSAAALIQALGGVEEIYRRLDEVPSLPLRGAASLERKLREHRDQAELSLRLATILDQGPVSASLDDLELRGARRELIDPLFESLGFGTIRERIPHWADD